MAEKEKEKDDKKEAEQPTLTPEERISMLEKGKMLSLILIIVLAVLSIAQMAGIGYLLSVPADERPGENAALLADMDSRLRAMNKIQTDGQKWYLQSQILEEKIDRVLIEADTHNFAKIRLILAEQERSYGDFIRSLQQGMYEISHMVRGSRTWYEVYKEELDKILRSSASRMAKLEGMKPASANQ